MTSFDLGEKENMQTVSSMLVYHTSHVMKNSWDKRLMASRITYNLVKLKQFFLTWQTTQLKIHSVSSRHCLSKESLTNVSRQAVFIKRRVDWITTLKTRSLFQNVCYVILIRDETCKIAELSKRSCHISLIDVHCRKTEHVSRELKTFTNPEPIDLAQSCHKLFNEGKSRAIMNCPF